MLDIIDIRKFHTRPNPAKAISLWTPSQKVIEPKQYLLYEWVRYYQGQDKRAMVKK